MTAKELIEKLSALHPDTPVLLKGGGVVGKENYLDVSQVVSVRVAPRSRWGVYAHFTSLADQNTVEAICLE